MNKHSPLPWTVRPHLPDAHFEVVADANDYTVGTATLPENAKYIVEAANQFETVNKLYHVSFLKADKALRRCDSLAAFVRELCEHLEKETGDTYKDLISYAREVMNEEL